MELVTVFVRSILLLGILISVALSSLLMKAMKCMCSCR